MTNDLAYASESGTDLAYSFKNSMIVQATHEFNSQKKMSARLKETDRLNKDIAKVINKPGGATKLITETVPNQNISLGLNSTKKLTTSNKEITFEQQSLDAFMKG